MDQPRITVAIIDSLFIVHEGLKHLVDRYEDFEIVNHLTEGAQLEDALRQDAPDVVIFDYDNNGEFKLNDLAKIKEAWPSSGLLIFSAHKQSAAVNQILAYKVQSYLFKECDESEIVSAIRASAKGDRFFCNKVLDLLIADKQTANGRPVNCAPTCLSQREVEVIENISHGYTAHEIADRMHLSVHTVNTHRKNIFKKLGVRSTAELVRQAMDSAWI